MLPLEGFQAGQPSRKAVVPTPGGKFTQLRSFVLVNIDHFLKMVGGPLLTPIILKLSGLPDWQATGWKKGTRISSHFCKPECTAMHPNSELPTTSVLFIDGSNSQRAYWTDQLRRCSPDYQIIEASDGQSGMDLFRSQRIDCVVLELGLPDQSGFQTLVELVPIASRPRIAVIVLTQLGYRSLWDLAKEQGAYACFHKHHTSGEDLNKAIQQAMAFVRQMPKEDEFRPAI
jgi:CheY-like chemotaxis protein